MSWERAKTAVEIADIAVRIWSAIVDRSEAELEAERAEKVSA